MLPGNRLSLISSLHVFHVPFSQKHTNQLWPQQNSGELCLHHNLLYLWQHKIKRKLFWVLRFNTTRLQVSDFALGSLTCSSSAEGLGSWWWKSYCNSNESTLVSNFWTHLSSSTALMSDVPKVAKNHLIWSSYSKSGDLQDRLEGLTLFCYPTLKSNLKNMGAHLCPGLQRYLGTQSCRQTPNRIYKSA